MGAIPPGGSPPQNPYSPNQPPVVVVRWTGQTTNLDDFIQNNQKFKQTIQGWGALLVLQQGISSLVDSFSSSKPPNSPPKP